MKEHFAITSDGSGTAHVVGDLPSRVFLSMRSGRRKS
jgi:hypothetical protein